MGAGTFILAAGYARTATVAVTCMCIGVAASGLMHSGYNVNMLDIAPRYACVIMGLTNTVGTVTGFLSPMMVGYITVNKVGLKKLQSTLDALWVSMSSSVSLLTKLEKYTAINWWRQSMYPTPKNIKAFIAPL